MNQGWKLGQVACDSYVVERKLGQGGMGSVYLVRDMKTGHNYAAKKTHLNSATERDAFMEELQTWIGLPVHANLTQCHFFRTVQDEVVIFAEYVSGGTLHDWIKADRIKREPLLLDIAIQFAWGLHIAHLNGVIHNDVKPHNALLTVDGTLKVSDFGIAKARFRAAAVSRRQVAEKPIFTPAYASPEQVKGATATVQSDVWSWGLSVLEMAAGGLTWLDGRHGLQILDALTLHWKEELGGPLMAPQLHSIIAKCFHPNPAQRWINMADICISLREYYKDIVGHESLRALTIPETINAPTKGSVRVLDVDTPLSDPRRWLHRALEESGQDPGPALQLDQPRDGSRRAQLISDIRLYDRAASLYEECIARGRPEVEDQLAELYYQKAFVHESVGDLTGTLAQFDRSIALFEHLVTQRNRQDLEVQMARVTAHKGVSVRRSGDLDAAVRLYQRAIAILRPYVARGQEENLYGETLINMGVAVDTAGRNREAIAIYDESIRIFERMRDRGDSSVLDKLTRIYMNKGIALHLIGEDNEAVVYYTRAIEVYEKLVRTPTFKGFLFELARTRENCAVSLGRLKRTHDALAQVEQATREMERVVEREGRDDFLDSLAHTYLVNAEIQFGASEYRECANVADKAIAAYEECIRRGVPNCTGQLARAQHFKRRAMDTIKRGQKT